MKICRILLDSEPRYAYEEDGRLRLFPDGWGPGLELPFMAQHSIAFEDVEAFLPPVTPSKIVCVGRNYAAHAAELNNPLPTEPVLFLKAPSALITEGEPIVLPPQSAQVEHEGELGIVIRRECKAIGENVDPCKYVLGYICVNDVTARDLQKRDVQFTRAKSFDTFCPVGRFIRTDADVLDTTIRVYVNGEIRQEGSTSDMIFDIPFLIRYISNQMTLKAGDLIATGTPSGVSRMNAGDICTVDIETVGSLSNPIAG